MNASFEILMAYTSAGLLWGFWHYFCKPQRADVYRQRLFEIRQELFDLARSGAVDFSHPAYTKLRYLMNGMIRFAPRATLPSLLVARVAMHGSSSNPMGEWKACVATLPGPVQDSLRKLHHRMFDAYLRHLFGGSFLLQALALAYLVKTAISRSSSPHRSDPALTYHHARHRAARKANAEVIEQRIFQIEHEQQRNGQRRAFAS